MNLVSIGNFVFRNCKSLATVTFEGGPDFLEVGYGASNANYGLFRDCPVVTLNLDRWLSYNTDNPSLSPFYAIETLKNINIGEHVGIIDKYMFSYCTGLESLYLPDNIESVALWGFRGCTALKNVRFSQQLKQISDYGFAKCTQLDSIFFPESMTSVASNSFSDCVSLKKLDLGNKLMVIGPSAFKNCRALEGITIPETLYGLGVEAFANCVSLPNVTIRSITSVGKQAFAGCTGLEWVSLSDKTTSLGENSFSGCTGIKYVKSYAEFPPEGLVNFPESVVANGTLYVPQGSIDYYTSSPTWENWFKILPIVDVMAASISINKTAVTLRENETEQLTTTVMPENANEKSVTWSSSDVTVAIVNNDGLVTAVAPGVAIITASTMDGSDLSATCEITVLAAFTPGDVNNDSKINVNDYVITASYILEQDPQPFNFAAADIDENGKVNVNDLVGVAALALTFEGAPRMMAPHALYAPSVTMIASLNGTGNKRVISVALDNNIGLTALQMDITLPVGITLCDAALSERGSASHTVATAQLDNGSYRLLAASSAIKAFKGNEGVLLTLTIEGNAEGVITLSDIQLATPDARGLEHDDIVLNLGVTGINDINANDNNTTHIYASGNNIIVEAMQPTTVIIALPNGISVSHKVQAGRNVFDAPSAGVVIVSAGDKHAKLLF